MESHTNKKKVDEVHWIISFKSYEKIVSDIKQSAILEKKGTSLHITSLNNIISQTLLLYDAITEFYCYFYFV